MFYSPFSTIVVKTLTAVPAAAMAAVTRDSWPVWPREWLLTTYRGGGDVIVIFHVYIFKPDMGIIGCLVYSYTQTDKLFVEYT